MNKNLILILTILFSGITQNLVTAESVITQVNKEKNVIASLRFPEIVKIVGQENLLKLVKAVFLDNHITLIKPLIKAICKNNSKNIGIIYETIIDWALQNKCDNVENFIKHIPNRTLHRPLKNSEPLAYHLIVQAMYNHNNSLVQYLITKVPSRWLLKKDSTDTSLLEHATQAKNTEAASIISDYLKEFYGEKSFWRKLGNAAANYVFWCCMLSIMYPGYTLTFFPFLIFF